MCFQKSNYKLLFLVMLAVISQLSFEVSCDDTYELACAEDSDCSHHFGNKVITAKCEKKSCHCHDTLVNADIPCKPQKLTVNNKIGNNCNAGCQMPNAHCDVKQNKCICNDDFNPTSDNLRCLPKSVPLKQPCESNDQCVSFDQFSACENKTCSCLTNFTQHDNECRSLVKMGEKCLSNGECQKLTDNGVCINNKCACQKGYISSANGNDCLKYGNYGDKCTELNQCLFGLGAGSTCSNGLCTCEANHRGIPDGNKTICKRIVHVNDSCDKHTDCYGYLENDVTMDCIQGHCACREQFEEKDSICFKKNSSSNIVPSYGVIFFMVVLSLITFAIAK